MRQKVALARALLREPEVLFLDEPTSALDPEAVCTVRDFIRELRSHGRTIVLCTHNLHEAEALCDRIGVLKQRLLRVDTPEGLRLAFSDRCTQVRLAFVRPEWLALLRELPFVRRVEQRGADLLVQVTKPESDNPVLVQVLVQAGAQVQYVLPVEQSLEDAYLALVSEVRQ